MHGGAIAIVGAAETERLGKVPELSVLELHADAALRALADCGLGLRDVDGFATAWPLVTDVAPYLGLRPRWLDGTLVGGCSAMLHVRHAAAALAAGLCDVALVTHGQSGRSGVDDPVWPAPAATSLAGQFELPHGAAIPPNLFTLPATRFLADRGMDARDLAEVVVAQRRWSAGVPRALRRDLVSVDDVLGAPMVADPFTRDMCCPRTDGGGALVLVRADRAASMDLAAPAVLLLGSGEAADNALVSEMADLGSFGAFRRASAEAFRTAGLTRADIDHLMVYDAFAHVPLYGLEDLGFVGRGESAAFIAEGHTSPGGRLPMNTNGGGLNYTHTGMYGMFAIQEAVRQVQGRAAMPVEGVRTSFVQGVGMMFGAAGSLVLGAS
jgi:acetyl-CoA acetyltransferase